MSSKRVGVRLALVCKEARLGSARKLELHCSGASALLKLCTAVHCSAVLMHLPFDASSLGKSCLRKSTANKCKYQQMHEHRWGGE